MSEENQLIEIERTIRGEWHWVVTLFDVEREPTYLKITNFGSRQDRTPVGTQEIVYFLDRDNPNRMKITLRKQNEITLAIAECSDVEAVKHCEHIFSWLESVVESALDLKRATVKQTADQVIEHYYRAKSRGAKITLKQLAERYDFNESYLRQAKIAYDRAGKWGSKSKGKREKT
jgi:hypothetical protein